MIIMQLRTLLEKYKQRLGERLFDLIYPLIEEAFKEEKWLAFESLLG